MTLTGLYLIPHGDEILDLPDENSRLMAEKIRHVTDADRSDSFAVISPHSLSLSKNLSVVLSSYLRVNYKLKTGALRKTYVNDRPLAERILLADPDFTESASLIASSGPNSIFPMDFGTAIPLQFFHRKKVSMMGQPRISDREALVRFGRRLYRAIEEYEGSVSLIISADQAHTHSAAGPYGYSPDAEMYDSMVRDAVKTSNLSSLMKIDRDTISRAKPDSYWNMLILHGILMESGISLELDFYYVAVYFGMLLGHGVLPVVSR